MTREGLVAQLERDGWQLNENGEHAKGQRTIEVVREGVARIRDWDPPPGIMPTSVTTYAAQVWSSLVTLEFAATWSRERRS